MVGFFPVLINPNTAKSTIASNNNLLGSRRSAILIHRKPNRLQFIRLVQIKLIRKSIPSPKSPVLKNVLEHNTPPIIGYLFSLIISDRLNNNFQWEVFFRSYPRFLLDINTIGPMFPIGPNLFLQLA